ncbi:MAG: hypothetical protein K2N25_09550 [Muribaculaceae bacterium]|nr:hypothetical protein [Muribaculaceae bacterium]
MRKLSSTLLLIMMLFISTTAWAEHVTEVRSWDFAKGSNHADQVTDCDC